MTDNDLRNINRRLEYIEDELGIDPREQKIKLAIEKVDRSHDYFDIAKIEGGTAYILLDGDITPSVIKQLEKHVDWWEFHQDKGQFVVGVSDSWI